MPLGRGAVWGLTRLSWPPSILRFRRKRRRENDYPRVRVTKVGHDGIPNVDEPSSGEVSMDGSRMVRDGGRPH